MSTKATATTTTMTTATTTAATTRVHRHLQRASFGRSLEVLFDHPLGKALHKLPKVISTQGSVPYDMSLKRTGPDGLEEDLGTLRNPKVESILCAARPSPFGKGEQTVFDESVRRGKEMRADELIVKDCCEYSSFLDSVETQIKKSLFPRAEGLSLSLYKLAVYEAGGHFAFHRDTTHAANHHATLLVEAKSAHKGGRLVFEVDGQEVPGIDFSAAYANADEDGNNDEEEGVNSNEDEESEEDDYDDVAWIAFYTDVRHKVEPVTEGTRIVLQYDVLVEGLPAQTQAKDTTSKTNPDEKNEEEDGEDGADDEEVEDKEEEDEDEEDAYDDYNEDDDEDEDEDGEKKPYLSFTQTVGDASLVDAPQLAEVLSLLEKTFADMDDPKKKEETKKRRRYWHRGSDKEKDDGETTIALPLFHFYRSESIVPAFLKSVDRELFFALLRTGRYDVALSPILIEAESDYENNGFPQDDYKALLSDPVEKVYTGLGESDQTVQEAAVGKRHPFNARPAQYIVSNREASKHIDSTSYIEYTGNEAQPAMHKYFLGAMLVRRKQQQQLREKEEENDESNPRKKKPVVE